MRGFSSRQNRSVFSTSFLSKASLGRRRRKSRRQKDKRRQNAQQRNWIGFSRKEKARFVRERRRTERVVFAFLFTLYTTTTGSSRRTPPNTTTAPKRFVSSGASSFHRVLLLLLLGKGVVCGIRNHTRQTKRGIFNETKTTHKVHSPFEYIEYFFKERERERKKNFFVFYYYWDFCTKSCSLFFVSLSRYLLCVAIVPSEGQNTPRVGVVWCPKKEERGSSGVRLEQRTFNDRVLKKKNRDPK